MYEFTAKTKLRVSPFFERTSKLNLSQDWKRWGGYLSASQYDLNHENEYFAIRTKVALLDITPLYKYLVKGADSKQFLNKIVTRNINICKIGQVMYTTWCDEDGKVIDDGTVQRLDKETFRITSAEPNYSWLLQNSNNLNVNIIDDSINTAALALQGPNSRDVINSISSNSINTLKFFWLIETSLKDIPVTISRTGYTGDLGYEIWMNPKYALEIWDLLIKHGSPYGITPVGLNALDIARIEASLVLLDVDYISTKNAIINERKSSPYELALDWTVKLNKNHFIGKNSLLFENKNPSKWVLRGIEIEWDPLESKFRKAGLPPHLPSTAWRSSVPIYYNNKQIGYATSGCWSPILKKYIALAHIQRNYGNIGNIIDFEIKVEHMKHLTPAKIVKTPFYNPERKRSCPI